MSLALTGNWQLTSSPTALQLLRYARRLRQGPLFRWRFTGLRLQDLLVEPVDLHLADPNLAHELYYGRYALGGRIVKPNNVSPFLIEPPSKQWEDALQDFSWLRHLDAAKTELAAAHARSLLTDWIDTTSRPIKGTPWRGDIVGRRIIAWYSHSSMLFDGATSGFIKKFMKSLGFQVRYLRTIIAALDDNEDRLQAHIALVFAAICQTVSDKQRQNTVRALERCLQRQILPDGGHISRNPALLLDLLADLISLRHTFTQKGEIAPRSVVDAVERMLPALRFFLHRDGSLARFHGVGPVLPERINILLSLDETAGQPFRHAPHSGYQRMASGGTTVIADTGYAPAPILSRHAHASCLSFEMSSGQNCFIINTGIDPFARDDLTFLGRTTAAHSTATINDTSSCRFSKKHDQGQARILKGPSDIKVRRIEGNERNGFIASHDGYNKTFNLIHERGILLSTSGKIIDGFDHFFSLGKETPQNDGRDQVAVRFHLHPDVEVSYDASGGLRLEIAGKDAWTFSCPDAALQLEDSVSFADLKGPRRTRQIVINVRPCLLAKVRWRLVRFSHS